jgi:hypothetical protein
MYIKIYVNALLYIDKVEIRKKLKRQLMKVRTGLVSDDSLHSEPFRIFILNPLFVTLCPETFSNLCVDSGRDM